MSARARSTSTSTSSRSRRRPPEVLTEPEAIALIKACSTRAPTGVRNRALIAVLWRSVGVDEQTSALLARWLDRRRKLSPGARAPIFCTLAGGRIDTSYVRRLLPRLAARAGVDRRVHAHGLRHLRRRARAGGHRDQRDPRRAGAHQPGGD